MIVSMDSKASLAKQDVQGHTFNSSMSLCGIRSTDGGCTVCPVLWICECMGLIVPPLSAALFRHVWMKCRLESAWEMPQPLHYYSAYWPLSTSPVFCEIPTLALPFPSLHVPKPALQSPLQPTKGEWIVDWGTMYFSKLLPVRLGHDNDCWCRRPSSLQDCAGWRAPHTYMFSTCHPQAATSHCLESCPRPHVLTAPRIAVSPLLEQTSPCGPTAS